MAQTSGALSVSRLYSGGGPIPRHLNESADDVTFSPGTIAWNDGLVTYAGPAEGYSGATESLENSCVVPGFVDCHTHLPFFGWRADEFEARLAGRSYRDLHGEGGISRSASMLASASDEEALEFCLPLVAEMTEYGTTAFEMKTGYGLSVEAEMRQARLARLLAAQIPQTTTLTLLVGHAVPQGMTRPDWVHAATNELIPAAAAEGLADMVDIYIEDIAFTVDDLVAVAEAAMTVGLPVRCHADQLGPSGAAEAAVRFGLRSADHLNHVSADGIAALGTADSTAAVLLPASTLMLRAQQPPVRELIDAGSIVALSSDFNPGTSPVLSMPEVFALGCSLYELSPAEALTATTSNPAWVLGLHDRLGTLAPGKRADFLVLDSKDVSGVPYRPGHNPVVHTFIGGVRAASRSSGP